MFAFVVTDTGPDDEGIAGFKTGEGWMAMVGADLARVDLLRPIAQQIADTTGKSLTVVQFELRLDVETIVPSDDQSTR